MGVTCSCSLLNRPGEHSQSSGGRVVADLFRHASALEAPVSAATMLEALASENYLRLPRLPLPQLEDTLERLRLSCRACASSEREFEQFERSLMDFAAGPGEELQATMQMHEVAHEGSPNSWLQEFWDKAQNGIRDPAPVNTGAFFSLEGKGTLACAKFALAFCKWSRKVTSGLLDADPVPLDMSLMGKLFSSAKIPKKGVDAFFQDASSTNIAIVSGGGIWSVDVFRSGRLLAPEVLAAALEAARASLARSTWESLPVLTAANRDVWAKERIAITANKDNRANLELLDKAILVIAVDKSTEGGESARAKNLLLGEASSRWWDKHQLILDATGALGLSFETSASDGTHWGRFIDECTRDAMGESSAPYTPLPRFDGFDDANLTELKFDLPPSTKQAIGNALLAYNRACADVDVKVLEYSGWGKAGPKGWSISPDASVQLGMQLAHFRLYGEVGAACETAHVRRFFAGRTELVRPCTLEARAMVEDWKDRPGTKGRFLSAIKSQSDLAQAAAVGGGIDRHLFVLERYAAILGRDVPLFRDALFLRSKAWMMATSNGTVPRVSLYGFAPAHPQGHGLGYVFGPSSINVCCTSFASSGRTSSAFCQALSQALDDVQAVFAEEEARLARAVGTAVPSERRTPSLLASRGLRGPGASKETFG